MRCLACDKELSDFEATRRYVGSKEFVDLCNKCHGYISDDVPTLDRVDLIEEVEEIEQEIFEFDDDN